MAERTADLGQIEATSTLDRGPKSKASAERSARTLARGESVGRYTVLEHLGTGGMGQVYAAYDPRLDRKVALKILRPFAGAAGRSLRARLLREARALAQLNDPNVLTLYDVGTFGDQVFLAMEYVPGVHLGQWLARGQHSFDEILEVFVQAGRGLVAAHEAGLVHRDFKLSNVMVRPDGRALVLDFGLARRERSDLDELASSSPGDELGDGHDGELTRDGTRLGTPLYMAPEQWAGQAAGPEADQFSFCVALFRALYGQLPFTSAAGHRAPADWTVRSIPAGVTDAGIIVPPRIRRVLLRGLAEIPADRYSSMRRLLADLAHDPWRRWRRIFAGAAIVTVLGLALWRPWDRPEPICSAGGERIASVWNAARSSQLQSALASTGRPYAATVARSVALRLDAYAGSWLGMYRDTCESTHVRGEQSPQLLDRRMRCLDQRRRELGALVNLVTADPGAAVEKAVSAVERLPDLAVCADTAALLAVIEPPSGAAEQRAIALLRDRLAEVEALFYAGQYSRATALMEPLLLDVEQQGYLPLMAEALVSSGKLESLMGAAEQASATLGQALRVAQVAHHDRAAADAFVRLVRIEGFQRADFEQAGRLAELASAMVGNLDRGQDLEIVLADYRGVLALQQGRFDEAAGLHRQALEMRHGQGEVAGPAMASTLIRLGNALFGQGKTGPAEARFQQALSLQEASLGADHPAVATTLDRLGAVAHNAGDFATAREYHSQALDVLRAVFGPGHIRLASTSVNLANVLSSAGDPEAALELYAQVLDLYTAEHGAEHPWIGITWINIGAARLQLSDFQGALEAFGIALTNVEAAHGSEHPLVGQVLSDQGEVLNELGRLVEAERLQRRALEIQLRSYGPDHPQIGHTLTSLGRSVLGQGRSREAAAHLERALELWRDSDTDPAHLAWARWLLAQAVESQDPERATQLARDAEGALSAAAGDHREILDQIRVWLEGTSTP